LNTCNSNSTVFPPGTDGAPGNDIQVTASYPMASPFRMFWSGAANSIQRIMF
jgi:hypothetical protein